jgi:hypothetical protein
VKEYDIFLPLADNDGEPIEPAKFRQLQDTLAAQFGAYTYFPRPNEGDARTSQADAGLCHATTVSRWNGICCLRMGRCAASQNPPIARDPRRCPLIVCGACGHYLGTACLDNGPARFGAQAFGE